MTPEIDAYIDRVVANPPPLTPAQRALLRRIFDTARPAPIARRRAA